MFEPTFTESLFLLLLWLAGIAGILAIAAWLVDRRP